MKTKVTPSPQLREFVRHYVLLETRLPVASPMIAKTEVVLAFGPGQRGGIFDHESGRIDDIPPVAIVGPRTRYTVDLRSPSGFSSFLVTFEPGGFSRLFGVDGWALRDDAYAGDDVLGPKVLTVGCAIVQARSTREKVGLVEAFLKPWAAMARRERSVYRAARALKATHGTVELVDLVDASGVSVRQFRREFTAQLGMSPKHFARVVRFEHALRLKSARPWMSWAEVSQDAGYYDQAHMVKDCRSLGAAPPSGLVHLVGNPLLTLSDETLAMPTPARRRA